MTTYSARPDAPLDYSEIKGAWFVTARRFALEEYGEETLSAIVLRMKSRYRHALASPLTSDWYDEEAMQTALAAARATLTDGTDDSMLGVLERCTLVGINHFWRIALRVTTTEFAVRMLPTTWRHMRRGPGTMSVLLEEGRAIVQYKRFPYFDDPNYRLLVVGTLGPLLRISTGREPRVTISGFGKTWLDAEIVFG
jgi:hypothetical protein